jgi:hypothetical protein
VAKRHYIDKADWRDGILMWIMFIVAVPIAVFLRLILGERNGRRPA